jgi:hypothetical protein
LDQPSNKLLVDLIVQPVVKADVQIDIANLSGPA